MKYWLVLMSAISVSGCSSFLATTTGPAPVGVISSERSLAQIVTDNGITKTAEINLYKLDPRFKFSRVKVDSFHSVVLLTGQVPDVYLKQLAEQNVKSMSDVKAVHNYLTVGDKAEYNAIVQDGMATAAIRKGILLDKRVKDTRVKVVTEAGVVYVMGRLTPSETQVVLEVIQRVNGIQKIVSLIDAMPEAPTVPVIAPPTLPSIPPASTLNTTAEVATPMALDPRQDLVSVPATDAQAIAPEQVQTASQSSLQATPLQ